MEDKPKRIRDRKPVVYLLDEHLHLVIGGYILASSYQSLSLGLMDTDNPQTRKKSSLGARGYKIHLLVSLKIIVLGSHIRFLITNFFHNATVYLHALSRLNN